MSKGYLFPGFIGVAAVWFATHAGGGFCTGRQEVEFFVKYGKSAVFMPFFAMAILGLLLFIGWEMARVYKTYNYKYLTDELYKPYDKILSILFEIGFILIAVLASSAGIAAGGHLLQELLNIPYFLGISLTAIFVGLLVIFGAELVRNASTLMSILIIAVLILVVGICLPQVKSNSANIISTVQNPGWLWKGFLYAMFQSWAIGAYISVSEVLKTRKDVILAAVTGFLVNSIMLFLICFTLLGFYPEIIKVPLPVLHAIESKGSSWNIILYSIALFLGNVSTAVVFIYGLEARTEAIYNIYKKNKIGNIFKNVYTVRILTAIVALLVAWSVSTFGLIRIVAKGYSYLGYVAIPLIFLPLIFIGISKINKNPE